MPLRPDATANKRERPDPTTTIRLPDLLDPLARDDGREAAGVALGPKISHELADRTDVWRFMVSLLLNRPKDAGVGGVSCAPCVPSTL